jgi:hypothetical protein
MGPCRPRSEWKRYYGAHSAHDGKWDLRDYLLRSKDGVALNPGSPFNRKEDSASLSSFAGEDIHVQAVLYAGCWSIIEIKLVSRQGRDTTVSQGLQQVIRYRDSNDRRAGTWLAVFDRTPAGRRNSWEERLSWDVVDTPSGQVAVVGG